MGLFVKAFKLLPTGSEVGVSEVESSTFPIPAADERNMRHIRNIG
jgi:hypothetical protein